MTDEPFLGSVALRRGEVTRNDLRRRYRSVHRDVYVGTDTVLSAASRARAAWLATGATLGGLSAAALLGTKWLDPDRPAEIIRADRHRPPGIVVRSYVLSGDDVCVVDQISMTTPARTAFDIGRTLPWNRAIPVLDALLNATDVKIADITSIANRQPGSRGVRRLRSALELVDGGAESPQETRVRLLLVRAGVPPPDTQIEFRELHVRVDMGWREWRVAVEYDGVQHWLDGRQRSWDIERIALLEAIGWTVVRVSAEMLARPDVIVARVEAKLRAAGCPI